MSWRSKQKTERRPKPNEMPYSEWLHDEGQVLHEFFTVLDPKLKVQKGGTLLLFAEDGKWKVCLNDRQTGMALWLSEDDLGPKFFQVVSDAMVSSKAVWRPHKSSQNRSSQNNTPRTQVPLT